MIKHKIIMSNQNIHSLDISKSKIIILKINYKKTHITSTFFNGQTSQNELMKKYFFGHN